MAFIPTLDGIRMSVEMVLDSQLCVHVLWMRTPVAPEEPALNDACDVVSQWWEDQYSYWLSDQVRLQAITARSMVTQNGLGVIRSGLNIPGRISGDCMPNNVTVAVAHRTGYTGRSARGRSYVPGIPFSKVDKNIVTPSMQDGLAAAWDTLISFAAGATLIWSVNSYYHNLAARPLGVMTAITNNTVNRTLDSMRRRLPERGA